MMVVCLDTNLLISGLHFAKRWGLPTMVVERVVSTCVLATSDELESEFDRVLTVKFAWPVARLEAIKLRLLEHSVRVRLDGSVQECRDPKDNMFLECAWRSKADFLVIGDKDLLVLDEFRGTRIVAAAEFLKLSSKEDLSQSGSR